MLSRLQNFLPQMAAANVELTEAMRDLPPERFDVEHIESGDEDKAHVEMDLGVGVVELQTKEAVEAAERAAGVGGIVDHRDDDSVVDDSDEGGKRRKKGVDAREDRGIEIPGMDGEDRDEEKKKKRAGIQELT